MIQLYGIKNCDTVKKARKWLEQHNIDYAFHDLREDGLALAQVQSWVAELGWENLINRRSTTWRELPDEDKSNLNDSAASTLILAHPTLIKRPLLEWQGKVRVGFKESEYESILAQDLE